MPELSRFAGIIVKMLFNDTIQHNKPHVMSIMESIKLPLVLMVSCLLVLCL